jgi:hypothetical protein
MALLVTLAGTVRAQSVPPETSQPQIVELQPGDVADRISFVAGFRKQSTPLYEVTGTTPFPGKVLYTDKLVFHPGGLLNLQASLRGTDSLLSPTQNDSNDIYIIAKSLVIENDPHSNAKPFRGGGITWGYEPQTQVPPDVGIATSGSVGGGIGAPGTPGADGVVGNPGYPGRRAPTLYLIFGEISGDRLYILLIGSPGGPGGVGQTGGNGGPGQSGDRAIFNIFNCERSGARGAPGGAAGNGGKGGTGGQGGPGGNLLIGSTVSTVSKLRPGLRVFARSNSNSSPEGAIFAFLGGGPGGNGGPGGSPGTPGVGGPGGPGSGTCSGGDKGPAGNTGSTGYEGDKGPYGPPGSAAVVSLPDSLLELLGFSRNGEPH